MKLIVGGCSVSDYTPGVDRVYGEILAEKIGADYIHEGAGCGSNYRMWRNITRMVMNNEIDENDIVLMQYTESTRQEYWSSTVKIGDQRMAGNIELRDKKYDGDIIRFKAGVNWIGKYEKKFFELKEKHFTSIEFDEECFEYHHYLFHNLMISRNIKVAYVMPTGHMAGYSWNKKHLMNKSNELHIMDKLDQMHPHELLQDIGHFNQKGHEYVATVLEKFIRDNQWQ
jgi:hypothetical protein